jgi:dihydroxyacetone kinase phosphoprotein-dependent L subunit
MSQHSLSAFDLRRTLAFVAERIAREEARLNALDAAIGDGDHGITMRVGFGAVKNKVDTLSESATIEGVLREAGMAFMGATGGAIGVLLGKMLMSAGNALKGHSNIGPPEVVLMLGAMETGLVSVSKARPGDKTILDAVHAVNQSLQQDSGKDLPELLVSAADAAQKAAENTSQMLARAGRASRLGDRALGHPDPGATSFAVILSAMGAWLQQP